MKKRVLAMITAITVAAGSVAFGETSYAAEELSFEEEMLIEEESVTEEASEEVSEDASEDASEEVIDVEEEVSEEVVEEVIEEAADEASVDNSVSEEILEEDTIFTGMIANPALYAASAKGSWILKKNKWTYENARGEAKDDDGNPLTDNVAHIGDNFYYFKDSYMCTGFIYFDEDGFFATSKNAKSARYCDPVSGILKTGMFVVEGKEYYALSDAKSYGLIRYNTIFSYNNNYYYADKKGVILKGKGFSLDGKSYYASPEGPLYHDNYRIIDGKYYMFNSDCSIDSSVEDYQPFYYAVKKNGETEGARAYLMDKNPNKPEEGRRFFADTERKKMLTSCWIYTYELSHKLYYLGKNGEMATGLTKIGGKYYLFGNTGANNSSVFQESYEGIYRKKDGTKCFILNGVMVTKKGFFYNKFQHSYYYVLNKSGELAKGDVFIKTKQYPKGKRYSFDSYCCLRVNDYSDNFVKHVVNHSNYENPEIKGPEDHFVLTNEAEVENFLTTPEGVAYKDFVFDTDGTLLNGISTVDGKKYLYYQGEPAHVKYVKDKSHECTPPFVMYVDGKGYLIGEDSAVMTGWFRIPAGGSVHVDFIGWHYFKTGAYMYFSPEDDAAVTGLYTAPVPKLDKNGEIVLDSKGNVVTTGKEAELCFTVQWEKQWELNFGYLVRNDEYVIDGKAYVTDGAGVAKLLEEGVVSEEGETIYRNADGSKATGRIDGSYYDPSTGYQLKNVIRCSSKKWYYYGKDGKESTALTEVTLDDDSKAFVTYKKDGSLGGFKYENGKKVSGRAFTLGASYYFIGKNGNLTTGVINQKLISKDVDVFTYVESDGLCYYKRSAYANKTFLVKLGKKLYVMRGGEPAKNSTKAYEVSDFSRLPKADMAVMERYQSQHCIYSPIRYTGELEDYNLPIYVNDDGSVFEGSMNRGESLVHVKHGVCLEDLSPFRREGKEWYYTAATEAGSMAWETYTLNNRGYYSIKRTMTFSWDNNMKLGKFMDASTGKPLSGNCICNYDAPSTGEKMELYICFKDGKLVTGKRVYRVPEGSFNFYYDPDTGMLDFMDLYRRLF